MTTQQPVSPERLATLRAAVETLLDRDGSTYTELSIGAICAEAGFSRPTFYASFEDKTDLVRTLAAETIGELVEASRTWLAEPRQSRDQLYQAFVEVFAAYAPHRKVIAAASEVASYDTELNDRFNAAVDAAAGDVAAHITRGQRDGLVRPELDPEMTGRWLGWMTERGMRRAFADRSTPRPKDIAAMTDLHWFTLYDGVA